MPSGKTARRLLTFCKPTDAPQISLYTETLANQLDNDVEGGQGKLSERPAAALRGRIYVVQGDATPANNGIVWWDTGSTWIMVNPAKMGKITYIAWALMVNEESQNSSSGDFTYAKLGTGQSEFKWITPRGTPGLGVGVIITPNQPGVIGYCEMVGEPGKSFVVHTVKANETATHVTSVFTVAVFATT